MDSYVHICRSGHVLIASHRISGQEFCEECGAIMLEKCPSCQSVIKEWHIDAIYFGVPSYKLPAYCKSCGEPYPWTKSALEAATDIVAEEKELSNIEQKKLIDALPALIVEKPNTQLAVVRLKKAFQTASSFTVEALRQFVIDFGCELVKKQLGL